MGCVCFTYYCFLLLSSGRLLVAGAQGNTDIDFSGFNITFLLAGIFIILAVILALAYLTNRLFGVRKKLKEKTKALDMAEHLISHLELRDKDMTDSLIYAQRIQEALLPSEDFFRNYFPDSFVYFKPKDIVSGDFYWVGEKGDKIFVAAADCTGHGVPGALMSVIGLDIITKTILEANIENPSAVLAVMNKDLEKMFSREKNIGTIIRDGMDLGLCIIDRKRKKIEYAGAFFPLYLVRDNTLTEIKGDKFIIGMNPKGLGYTTHEIDIKVDDIIYIFSDGYVDQFGGTENKKFMYRRFRYLLLQIHRFSFKDQKSILEENMRSWMMDNSQVDDIMVIGFRPLREGH